MELPPAIIAQAEAAAISNSTEIDYLAQSTTSPNQAPPESSSDGSAKQEGHTSSNQLDSYVVYPTNTRHASKGRQAFKIIS